LKVLFVQFRFLADMKNLIKDTWLAGVMLFGSLLGKQNNTKTVEVHAEDLHPSADNSTAKTTKNESKNV